MDVFKVHEQVIADYRAFTSGSVEVWDRRIRGFVDEQFTEGVQWPDPWLSLNPSFATGGAVPDLVGEGLLHSECIRNFVRSRVLELTYTSHLLREYAQVKSDKVPGVPFRWLPERRSQIIAELEAAMMHVYGLDRDDVAHVLGTFAVLQRSEERAFGEFRTHRMVLAEFDAMAAAASTRLLYKSPLHPPPGQGPRHPARSA